MSSWLKCFVVDMIANELKKGMVVRCRDAWCSILEYQHVRPGKGPAYLKCKLRKVQKGKTFEENFRATEKIVLARITETLVSYIYQDSSSLHFLESESLEEVTLPISFIPDEKKKFLKEGIEITLVRAEGEIIEVRLPIFVDLKVIKTEPGFKGNRVSAARKMATLETGFSCELPLFIKEGDIVRLDTRTGEYIGRQ